MTLEVQEQSVSSRGPRWVGSQARRVGGQVKRVGKERAPEGCGSLPLPFWACTFSLIGLELRWTVLGVHPGIG